MTDLTDQTTKDIEHLLDLQRMFFTPEGQRVMARLEADFCGSTFQPLNQKVQDFKEGERHVVLVIKERLAMTVDEMAAASTATARTTGDAYAD